MESKSRWPVIESQVEYIGDWKMAGEYVLTVFHRHRPRDVIAADVQHFCKKKSCFIWDNKYFWLFFSERV